MDERERELAAELQQSKDDETEWGATTPPNEAGMAKRGRLSAMVSVRLTPEELEQVQRRAHGRGQTVSAYLRSLATHDNSSRSELHCPSVQVSIQGPFTSVTRLNNDKLMADGGRLLTYGPVLEVR